MFRKTLRQNDPLRNWTLAYSIRGDFGVAFTLHNEVTGQRFAVLPDQLPGIQQALPTNHVRLPLPPDVTPGTYTLLVGGEPRYTGLFVQSEFGERGKPVTLAAGADADAFERAMVKSSRVTLAPGVYHFDRAITWPDNTLVIAYGAHLWRHMSTDPNDYGQRMFVPGRNCTLFGGDLYPVYLVWHGDDRSTGLVMSGSVLHGGVLGWNFEEAVFDEVEFENTRVEFAPKGLYYHCRWTGTPSGANAFVLQGGGRDGAYAVVDCRFDATDRGPVANLNAGPFRGNLFHGTRCRDLVRGENGNEIIMCEGGYGVHDFSENLVYKTRAVNCSSGIFQLWDCPARNNLCTDLETDGNCVVWLAGWGGVEVTGNEVNNFELRNGGRIQFGCYDNSGRLMSGNVRGNRVVFGGITNYFPGRQNQPSYPELYAPRPAAWATPADAGNELVSVQMSALCPGAEPAVGVNCIAVTCDGKVVLPKFPVA